MEKNVYDKNYYVLHREEIKARSRAYRTKHKEEVYTKRKKSVLEKYKDIKVESLEGEEWRNISNCEGYQVSNFGRVKSLDYKGCHYEKILKESKRVKNNGKVIYCWIYINKKWFPIHRLVALSFPDICGYYFEGAEVSHKNTVSTDNRAVNLCWDTHRGNINNPITKQKMKESQKGKVFTKEHRKHLSEARREWWANC